MIQLADVTLNTLKWTLEREADQKQVNDSLALRIGAISGLKTFPVVAQKVISLLSKSDFTIDEITDAIRQDPSLAAGVLRLANSPFYIATHPITSLDVAFVRLGRNTVREVIFAVATMQLFPDANGLGRMIRDHCAATATIGHVMASRLRIGTPEVLFLAGLMHDIGIMLLMDSGEVHYNFQRSDALTNTKLFRNQELEQLGFDHAILGAQVLSRWKVGGPVPQLVACHHLPELASQTPEISSLVALLRLADAIDMHLCKPGNTTEQYITSECQTDDWKQLNLKEAQILDIWPEIEEAKKYSQGLFP